MKTKGGQRDADQAEVGQNVPPLIKGDETVVVQVELVEETRQSLVGDRQASALKGSLELLLIEPAVLVAVDGPEQQE